MLLKENIMTINDLWILLIFISLYSVLLLLFKK